jgi:lipoate-protein ligase A
MEDWRILDLEYPDPYLNMAIEESILLVANEGLAPNTIRLWRNPRSVVIGRFQNVADEVDLKVCAKHGIKVVRRFTGGGTVYHDYGNLNWTVIVKKDSSLYPKMLLEIYKAMSNAVIEGLKSLKVHTRFKPPNIIEIGSKKISGLAAYVKRNAALCHGTLLVHADLNVLSKVLLRPRATVTTLQNELRERISISLAKEAIFCGFNELYGIEANPEKLNKYEKRIAETLYQEKYKRDEWNFKGNLS